MTGSKAYLTELHNALAHLDDPPYLERHPLASRIPSVASAPALSRGQALRRALRLGIAALDPGAGGDRRLEARCYQVLYRWAVAREGMVAIAGSLGIGTRQAYRYLQTATEALAQVLGGVGAPEAVSSGQAAGLATGHLGAELARLAQVTEQDVDLERLLAEATESARILARESGVEIALEIEVPGLHAAAHRVMLRQAILNLLSHVVSSQRGGSVAVHLRTEDDQALLSVSYRPDVPEEISQPNCPYAVAAQLLQSLGLRLARQASSDGTIELSVAIPRASARTLVIVDDNEGVIALFKGFLRHQPYRVHGVTDPDRGVELLQQLQPDAVILDVMMPDRDGWEVLQQIRATEAGRRARIIVCSVINDPKLALALGADAFLNKPVDRAGLLQALTESG